MKPLINRTFEELIPTYLELIHDGWSANDAEQFFIDEGVDLNKITMIIIHTSEKGIVK